MSDAVTLQFIYDVSRAAAHKEFEAERMVAEAQGEIAKLRERYQALLELLKKQLTATAATVEVWRERALDAEEKLEDQALTRLKSD